MPSVSLHIHDVAFGGNGVGRLEGKAVFVPLTVDGEQVSARITKQKKQFAEAALEQVIEESPHRTTPECPYFGRCGGCSYQHISYEHQLELKHRQVEQALRRIGRFEEPQMRLVIPSPKHYGYRNRITVHAENGVIGYYRREAHELIDVKLCPIAAPEVNDALAELRARKPRDGHYTLRAHPRPRVFEQTNDEVAAALAQLVARMLPERQALLIDAYCAAGFFVKRLRDRFDRIVGIEWDRYAVAAARANATEIETYIEGDVDLELATHLASAELSSTSVIIDPPATGIGPNARRALVERPPHTIIYVSCNPATMARDLAELRQQFILRSVTPLDMFPQTAEIECVAHLENATNATAGSSGF